MIEHCTLDDAQDLDDFVRKHPRGHYMQTTYYGRSRPDYHWNGIVIRNPYGEIIASIALHSRPSHFLGKCLFYAPRGPVFTTIDQFRQIIIAAKEYCRKHNGYLLRIDPPISIEDKPFVREAKSMKFHFNPKNDYSTYQPKCVYKTNLAQMTEEMLLSQFHAKTRYNIRLAQRRGVSVREGTLSDIPVFHAMMKETAKRDGFECKAEEFYFHFLRTFGEHAKLYLAEKNGQILAGAIEVIFGSTAWYAYGSSFTQGREDMPNHILQWEMMRYAMNRGCTIYDFRGVEGLPISENPHYGLHRFKQGFHGMFLEYAGQMDLMIRPFAALAIQLGQKLCYMLNRRKKSRRGNTDDNSCCI